MIGAPGQLAIAGDADFEGHVVRGQVVLGLPTKLISGIV